MTTTRVIPGGSKSGVRVRSDSQGSYMASSALARVGESARPICSSHVSKHPPVRRGDVPEGPRGFLLNELLACVDACDGAGPRVRGRLFRFHDRAGISPIPYTHRMAPSASA